MFAKLKVMLFPNGRSADNDAKHNGSKLRGAVKIPAIETYEKVKEEFQAAIGEGVKSCTWDQDTDRKKKPSRFISHKGVKFGVGLTDRANSRNRWKRLSTLQVGEQMCFMDKRATVHKSVENFRRSWEGQDRNYVIHIASISGPRVPSQEATVVTRVQ